MKKIVLLGAGGHARVLIDTLQADLAIEICALTDGNQDTWGTTILGIPVVGNDDCLAELFDNGVSSFVVAVGGPKQATLRRQLFEIALQHGMVPCSVRHPTATHSTHAVFDEGVQLLAQSVVNTGATLGCNVLVNTGAIVEHDCVVESHAHIAPRSCLAGGVHVGRGAHIGLGAVIKENVTIGQEAIVGAGAVVIDDVPANSVVVGVPAKPIWRKEAA